MFRKQQCTLGSLFSTSKSKCSSQLSLWQRGTKPKTVFDRNLDLFLGEKNVINKNRRYPCPSTTYMAFLLTKYAYKVNRNLLSSCFFSSLHASSGIMATSSQVQLSLTHSMPSKRNPLLNLCNLPVLTHTHDLSFRQRSGTISMHQEQKSTVHPTKRLLEAWGSCCQQQPPTKGWIVLWQIEGNNCQSPLVSDHYSFLCK